MTETVFGNLKEYSVSELSLALKRTVEDTYELVRVRGEISGFKRAASGHLYMALKDADAVLDAVCWRGTAIKLPVKLEDGLEVVATGKLTTYPGRSKYQMVIQHLELAGAGALMALLEERKKKLAAEGLFDASRKRPIPYLPQVIGVITSPTGAVIRDILHRISDRFARDVLVWPVQVQGEGAAQQVAAAIAGFNALPEGGDIPRPDVLIVARGGGSIEDLWAFNEEIVVRAAAASQIPLISAVGHETDTTLIDFASDLRAPTPTAAAEKAVPVRVELLAQVATLSRRLEEARRRMIMDRAERLQGLARGLPKPRDLLSLPSQRLDEMGERLPRALLAGIERRRVVFASLSAKVAPLLLQERLQRSAARVLEMDARLPRALLAGVERRRTGYVSLAAKVTPHLINERIMSARRRVTDLDGRQRREVRALMADKSTALNGLHRVLQSLSYEQALARGFVVVRDGNGRPLMSAAAVVPGGNLDLQFADGHVAARAVGAPVPRKPRGPKETDDQGTLL